MYAQKLPPGHCFVAHMNISLIIKVNVLKLVLKWLCSFPNHIDYRTQLVTIFGACSPCISKDVSFSVWHSWSHKYYGHHAQSTYIKYAHTQALMAMKQPTHLPTKEHLWTNQQPPHTYTSHTLPPIGQLANCPTATHDGAIRNLHTFVTQAHKNREIGMAKSKFPYVDKWVSNTQINQKISNHLWKNKHVTDAQITQKLKLRYAQ